MVDLISDDVTNVRGGSYGSAQEARRTLEQIVSLALDIRETHAAISSVGKINGNGGAAEVLDISPNAVYLRIATHVIDPKRYRQNVSDSELFKLSGKMRSLVQKILPYLMAFEGSKNNKQHLADEIVEEMERRNIFD
jgi:hypothetical protein